MIDRDEWEAQLARVIQRALQRQFGAMLEELGDPPDIRRLTPDWWAGQTDEFVAATERELLGLFLESAEQLADVAAAGVSDWALVNQRAVDWARSYSYDLSYLLTGNTRDLIEQALLAQPSPAQQQLLREGISEHFTTQMTLGQLRERLAGAFGPVRAATIAITEVTRAAAQGEIALAEIMSRDIGARSVPVWQTRNDELVCPICGPRHGQPQGEGWTDPPPAHPRCRCGVNHRILLPDETGGERQIPFFREGRAA